MGARRARGVHSLRALMISALATVFALVAAANLSLPAGLFMPTILYGGLLGRASAIVVERALRGTGLRVNHQPTRSSARQPPWLERFAPPYPSSSSFSRASANLRFCSHC